MKNSIANAITVFTLLSSLASLAQAPATSSAKVRVTALTNAAHQTLYVFDGDAKNQSHCEGDCIKEWPAFTPSDTAQPDLSSGLDIFTRTDGSKQYSLKGRPLYRFSDDANPGDALGSEDDGLWHVVVIAEPAPEAPAFVEVSGCKENDYVEGTLSATIAPSPTGGYTPRCLKVHVGAKVTLAGSATHPVQGMANVGSAINPFVGAAGGQKSSVTNALTQAGFYGFFCTRHGTAQGAGMAGAIQVVP